MDIHLTSYNRLGEIFLSGYPLLYDSMGYEQYMSDAGMFDIKAVQSGENLKVAPETTQP